MIPIIFAAAGVILGITTIYTKNDIYIIPASLCTIISNVYGVLLQGG